MSKNILITGGSGQLGSTLFSDLKKTYNVIKTSKTGFLDSIKLDITNSEQVRIELEKYNPDIIINCASFNNVDECELKRKNARDVIVQGLDNLIKASKKKCKIVQISSDYVFDGSKEKYSELDRPNPVNYYGRLKLEAENLLRSSNRDFIIFRCSCVFSGLMSNKSNFLSWLYNNLKANNVIRVVRDQVSNPASVELISNVLNLAIVLNSKGIFNIGSLDPVSRFDFAVNVCDKFGFNKSLVKNIQTESLDQLAKRPKRTFLAIDKIINELDIDVYSFDYYLNNIKKGHYE